MRSFFKRRLVIAVTIVIIIAVALSIVSAYTGGAASPISNAVSVVLTPFREAFTWAANGVGKIISYISDFDALKLENEALKKELNEKEQLMRDAEKYREENEKLRNLLDISLENEHYTLEMCDVISRNDSDWSRCFTINKGSDSGISVGDSVIISDGLVGYVAETGSNWSEVITVIDSGMSVGAQIIRTNESMICEGDFYLMKEGKLRLSFIALNSSVYTGDEVSTSGIGGNIPSGLMIGEVVEIAVSNDGSSKYAVISPYVDVESLTVVFVITDFATGN